MKSTSRRIFVLGIAILAIAPGGQATALEGSLAPDKLSVRAPTITAGQTLAIAAAAPWDKPSRLQPAPSDAVLAIDGVDVGRKLLEAAR